MIKPTALHLFLQPSPEINITDNNSIPTFEGRMLLCPCCGGCDMRPIQGGVTLDSDGVTIEMTCPDGCGDVTLDIVHPNGTVLLGWRHSKRGRAGA